ncbi:hypothetical protein [Mesorhizobium sp. ORM16]|uniref:hypothetical protein n=1 Tax=Mesorhizobium sp. ORM16 TaxID=3376989 RepID=UPI0038573230
MNNKHALFGRALMANDRFFRRKYFENFDAFCDCDKKVRFVGLAARWRLASRTATASRTQAGGTSG